jgi:hypothetical protein
MTENVAELHPKGTTSGLNSVWEPGLLYMLVLGSCGWSRLPAGYYCGDSTFVTTPHESDGFHVSYAGEKCVDIKANAANLSSRSLLSKENVCHPKENVCHPEHLTGMVHDTQTYEKHDQRVTVRNVTFPDVLGGPQDHEEPRGTDESHRMLCPVQSRCVQHQQVSSHEMTTVSCQEGSSYSPWATKRTSKKAQANSSPLTGVGVSTMMTRKYPEWLANV